MLILFICTAIVVTLVVAGNLLSMYKAAKVQNDQNDMQEKLRYLQENGAGAVWKKTYAPVTPYKRIRKPFTLSPEVRAWLPK